MATPLPIIWRMPDALKRKAQAMHWLWQVSLAGYWQQWDLNELIRAKCA
jgi:hypothetical protein